MKTKIEGSCCLGFGVMELAPLTNSVNQSIEYVHLPVSTELGPDFLLRAIEIGSLYLLIPS